MRWSEIPRNPPISTLRWFGIIAMSWFGAVACLAWNTSENEIEALSLVVISLLLGSVGLAAPALLRIPFVCSLIVTFPIGWFISHLVLGVVYYCLFTPLGLIFRLFGRDPLERRWDSQAVSYWKTKSLSADLRSYFCQS